MTILATDGVRFSQVVKHEYPAQSGYCRDMLTVNDAAATLQVGSVLGAYIASPTATAGAVVGTGNATVGTISVVSTAQTKLDTYLIMFLTATTFQVEDSKGSVIGTGATGTAFTENGITFTVTAGGTAMTAGSYIPLVVSGTTKYRLVSATATDGSQVAKAVLIADQIGLFHPTTLVANTDTPYLALTRGPAIVASPSLSFNANVTGTAITTALSQLASVGIISTTQV